MSEMLQKLFKCKCLQSFNISQSNFNEMNFAQFKLHEYNHHNKIKNFDEK